MNREQPNHNPENTINPRPVIRLTENRDALALKLKEYQDRLKLYKPPEEQISTVYKIAVAEQLVAAGEVDTNALAQKLAAKYGFLDEIKFENACGVIADYVATGGRHVHGGTGLPKTEEN